MVGALHSLSTSVRRQRGRITSLGLCARVTGAPTAAMAVNQQQLRLWFDQIDLDKNNVLNVREVQKCLALNKLAFSLTSTNMLMRLFDTDHSGTLTFEQVSKGQPRCCASSRGVTSAGSRSVACPPPSSQTNA